VRRRADITVRVRRRDGQEETVDARRTSAPQTVIRAVGNLLEGGEE
jgi:hypothetical protein